MSAAKSSTASTPASKRPSLSTIIQGRYHLRPRQPRTRPFEGLYRKQNETTDDVTLLSCTECGLNWDQRRTTRNLISDRVLRNTYFVFETSEETSTCFTLRKAIFRGLQLAMVPPGSYSRETLDDSFRIRVCLRTRSFPFVILA